MDVFKVSFLERWKGASEMSARRTRECKRTNVVFTALWVCLKSAMLTFSLSWKFLQKAAAFIA